MTDFLIYYQNNVAKIGKTGNSFKLKSFNLPAGLTTEDNSFLTTENGAFLIWYDYDEDSLVYRFLATDILPSPQIDTDRVLYGD